MDYKIEMTKDGSYKATIEPGEFMNHMYETHRKMAEWSRGIIEEQDRVLLRSINDYDLEKLIRTLQAEQIRRKENASV